MEKASTQKVWEQMCYYWLYQKTASSSLLSKETISSFEVRGRKWSGAYAIYSFPYREIKAVGLRLSDYITKGFKLVETIKK